MSNKRSRHDDDDDDESVSSRHTVEMPNKRTRIFGGQKKRTVAEIYEDQSEPEEYRPRKQAKAKHSGPTPKPKSKVSIEAKLRKHIAKKLPITANQTDDMLQLISQYPNLLEQANYRRLVLANKKGKGLQIALTPSETSNIAVLLANGNLKGRGFVNYLRNHQSDIKKVANTGLKLANRGAKIAGYQGIASAVEDHLPFENAATQYAASRVDRAIGGRGFMSMAKKGLKAGAKLAVKEGDRYARSQGYDSMLDAGVQRGVDYLAGGALDMTNYRSYTGVEPHQYNDANFILPRTGRGFKTY